MSFGYLVITSYPCPSLTQKRGETFLLLMEKSHKYIYFRFCENNFYTNREKEVAEITDIGMDFFREVYEENQGKFLFIDVLLDKQEGEIDFAKIALQKLHKKEVTVIKPEKNLKIKLRQDYIIDFK